MMCPVLIGGWIQFDRFSVGAEWQAKCHNLNKPNTTTTGFKVLGVNQHGITQFNYSYEVLPLKKSLNISNECTFCMTTTYTTQIGRSKHCATILIVSMKMY